MPEDPVSPDSPLPRTTDGRMRWEPPSPEELQAMMPGYTIERLLGRGGMGAVYKGVQRNLDRPVAIKILPPGVEQEDPSFADRFRNEAKLMAKLLDPTVVGVFDFGTTLGGQLYIAMEYVDGTDVLQMIRSQKKLPPEHALAITAHVCDALTAAHRLGIVHRDIKPANILINQQGQVKVADFGLAKIDDPGSHGLTKTGYAMGTPDFIAPEMLTLGSNVDGRADLYAVGVMLYQMLTGEVPRGAFKPASTRLPGLDPRFDPIILKALQSDREERYQSSTDLRRDLDVILTVPMEKVTAAPKSSTAIPGQTVVPQRSAAKPAATPQHEAEPIRPAPKASSAGLVMALLVVLVVVGGIAWFLLKPESPEQNAASSAPLAPSPAPAKAVSPAPVVAKPSSATKPAEVVETKPAAPPPAATSKPSPAMAPVATAPVTIAPATPASALDQRLAVLESGFQAAVERDAGTAFKASITALDKSYLAALDRALTTASTGGKLEEAVALREEKQRIEKGEGLPSEVEESTLAVQPPATLKTLRQTYRSTVAQHEAAKLKAMQPLFDKYDQALAAVQTELTKASELDDALRVKTVREQIAAARGGEMPLASPAASAVTTKSAATSTSGNNVVVGSFTNSLGMKFVPVPDTDILMCIHETRRQDYAVYAAEVPGVDSSWKTQEKDGIPCGHEDNHPVVGVNWEDAQSFCKWLSTKDGRNFRLASDREWSIAVGLGRKEKWTRDTTPKSLHNQLPDFPWDGSYPPKSKDRAGNYADTSWHDKFPDQLYIDRYTDGFPTTAPVMSFKANKLGLYDMGGNVSEWVEDWYDAEQTMRTARDGGFMRAADIPLRSSSRNQQPAQNRANHFYGFRVVVDTRVPASTSAAATKPATPTPTPPITPAPAPATATKGDFTNSLGMKFVKVTGTKVLFCIHETRKGDYAKYAAEVPGVDDKWKEQTTKEGLKVSEANSHPVVAVDWNDARAFCAWLSGKEGRTYRLPTDREWSYAAGIGKDENPDTAPKDLGQGIRNEYPWGTKYPPPNGSGNYADMTYRGMFPSSKVIDDYTDGYISTAPVMCFKPNKLGIYDLGGNVWEFCEDYVDGTRTQRVTRGASWKWYGADVLLSSFRGPSPPNNRANDLGFRIVLETAN